MIDMPLGVARFVTAYQLDKFSHSERGGEARISESGAEFLGYENNPKLDKQIRNAFFKAEEVIASFDLVLYEQFFFVGKHLADKHGKKCVWIFTAPLTSKELMRTFISSGGPMGLFRSFQPFAEDFSGEQFHFIGPSVYDRQEGAFLILPKGGICISLGTILKGRRSFSLPVWMHFRMKTS